MMCDLSSTPRSTPHVKIIRSGASQKVDNIRRRAATNSSRLQPLLWHLQLRHLIEPGPNLPEVCLSAMLEPLGNLAILVVVRLGLSEMR
uniref:Uncharacterized protein n=1 Tax=Brassica oleracea TaxID=3712 RepID=A0A3P6GCM2_BRAOL|nr:unnamed protein product [Brassica oleracea]